MSPVVSVVDVEPLPTAVIATTTTWSEFPRLWGQLLGEVWTFLRANDDLLRGRGSSVMLYKNDTPSIEVGVLVASEFAPSGRIVPSQLPGGPAAHAVHRGPYSDLGVTHDAIVAWCMTNDRPRTGARWEIYGDHHDDPSQLTTDVYWQLADGTERTAHASSRAPGRQAAARSISSRSNAQSAAARPVRELMPDSGAQDHSGSQSR